MALADYSPCDCCSCRRIAVWPSQALSTAAKGTSSYQEELSVIHCLVCILLACFLSLFFAHNFSRCNV